MLEKNGSPSSAFYWCLWRVVISDASWKEPKLSMKYGDCTLEIMEACSCHEKSKWISLHFTFSPQEKPQSVYLEINTPAIGTQVFQHVMELYRQFIHVMYVKGHTDICVVFVSWPCHLISATGALGNANPWDTLQRTGRFTSGLARGGEKWGNPLCCAN